MKIQPTEITASSYLNFGNRHTNTKLPKNLQAKPVHKVSKGLLISLIPLSLLGFGTYYWQTHKQEAKQKELLWRLERLLKTYQNTLPADTISNPPYITPIWGPLSSDTIQNEIIIPSNEALKKYTTQTKDTKILSEKD